MANIETLLADTRYYAEVAAPSTPASGGFVTYAKSDGKLYGKNDAGTEYDLTAGSGVSSSPHYVEAIRTAGTLGLNATAITEVASGLRLVLAATSGDLIEYGVIALVEVGTNVISFDAYTHDGSHARVNPFAAGLSASAASTLGVPAWYQASNSDANHHTGFGPPVHRVLVSGDIAGGNVEVGLWYSKANTNVRNLFATANIPLRVWMRNLGQ